MTRYNTYIRIIPLVMCMCTFNSENTAPLRLTRIGAITDTISVWPELAFLFTVPLRDSLPGIIIMPDPGPVYSVHLMPTRDTAILTVSGSLKGSTRYRITLAIAAEAENGSILQPEYAAFDLFTYPKEQEPNNGLFSADTLAPVVFGELATAHDTDLFIIPATGVRRVSMICHTLKANCFIRDTQGTIHAADSSLKEIKALSAPSGLTVALVFGTYSHSGAGARYELKSGL